MPRAATGNDTVRVFWTLFVGKSKILFSLFICEIPLSFTRSPHSKSLIWTHPVKIFNILCHIRFQLLAEVKYTDCAEVLPVSCRKRTIQQRHSQAAFPEWRMIPVPSLLNGHFTPSHVVQFSGPTAKLHFSAIWTCCFSYCQCCENQVLFLLFSLFFPAASFV